MVFLGMTNYYKKFVKVYGKLARPLTNLMKKNGFVRSDEAIAVFEMLKQNDSDSFSGAIVNFLQDVCHRV